MTLRLNRNILYLYQTSTQYRERRKKRWMK
nr:MAG TPA: hypothetical protein [Caudoviricetes sp.]